MIGTTIATRGDLARARILAQSFLQQHPASRFTILVPDAFGLSPGAGDGVEMLGLEEIGLAPEDIHRLPKIYRGAELALAVKPWLLRSLLTAEPDSIFCFDDDIEIFGPLDDAAKTVAAEGPTWAARENENGVKRADTGFIGIGRSAGEFLASWCATLRAQFNRDASLDPSLCDGPSQVSSPRLLHGAGFNVGYWSLVSRGLHAAGDAYEVDGEPLRFFHFEDYDPKRPHLLSTQQPYPPRVLLSESVPLRKICDEYRAKLAAAEEQERQSHPCGYGLLPSGIRIDRFMQRLYRRALLRSEQKAGPKPPDPFRAEGENSFFKWLNQRAFDGQPIITRYMLELHAARGDLQDAFPEPLGRGAAAFHSWFVITGAREEDVPECLLPSDATAVFSLAQGVEMPKVDTKELVVDVVGYFRAELGIGEAARLLVTGLEAADVRCNTFSFGETANRQEHAFDEQRARSGEVAIQIICVNADQLAKYAEQSGKHSMASRYTIGFWFWEASEFPESLHPAFKLVDEVWVASEFVRDALLKVSPVPVYKIDLPLVRPDLDASLTRSDFGMPAAFTFLFSFDYLSVLERKNPLGLVNAFKQAFATDEGPVLFIKSINGVQRVAEMEKLKYAAASRPDIVLQDGYLSAHEKNTMMALCDCYVSLHRAEGFGLTMAEAMALGKPVIATGYSGNLAFMTAENSYICPSRMEPIGPDREPYPPRASWAEPDLDSARNLLRHVYEQRGEAEQRGRRAADDLEQRHSPALAGRSMRDRLEQIQRRLSVPEAERSAMLLRERLQFLEEAAGAIRNSLDAANEGA